MIFTRLKTILAVDLLRYYSI